MASLPRAVPLDASPPESQMRLLVATPFLLLLVLFALSNRQPVAIGLWPTDLTWQVPLSIAVLIAAGLAFLLGGATGLDLGVGAASACTAGGGDCPDAGGAGAELAGASRRGTAAAAGVLNVGTADRCARHC